MENFDVFETLRLCLLALIFIGVFLFFKWKLGRLHMYKLAAKFDCDAIKSLPLFGVSLPVILDPESMNDIIAICAKRQKPIALWLGPILLIFSMRPEDLKIILKHPDCIEKNIFYKYVGRYLPETLFVLTVNKWKKRRKLVAPSFSPKTLATFIDTFNVEADALVGGLEENGQVIDIMDHAALSTIKSTLENLIGINVSDEDSKYMQFAIQTVQKLATERMFNILQHPDILFYFTKSKKIIDLQVRGINDRFSKLILQKLTMEQTEEEKKEKSPVVFDLMVSAMQRGEVSIDDIVMELKSILIASYDTTSKTFCYLLLCLALNPDVQEKLYREVKDVLGDNEIVTSNDFPKFVYLEMVLKETLRLFPALSMMGRKAVKDIDLGDYTIPAGAQILISIFEMHRSEVHFPDPMKFDPERFTSKESAKRDPFSYLPFSHGPRNCVGFQYAMSNLKVFVPKLMLKFKVETSIRSLKDITFFADVFLESKVGYPIKLIRRTKS